MIYFGLKTCLPYCQQRLLHKFDNHLLRTVLIFDYNPILPQ